MKPFHVVLATLPPILWALAYLLVKPVTAHFPPLLMTAIAYAITAALLFRPKHRWATPVWAIVVAATLGTSLQSALIFIGLARVPASTGILVDQSQVPFAVIASWLIAGERIGVRRLAGIAVAMAGVVLIIGAPAQVHDAAGLLLIVLGTLSWGLSQGIIRAKSRDPGGRFMGLMSLIAAPQVLIASFIFETGQRDAVMSAGAKDWALILVFSLSAYVVPYIIWYGLLRLYRVDQIVPFTLLMPVVGVIAGVCLLGEPLSISMLLGGAIVLLGLAVIVRAPVQPDPADAR